MFNLNTKFDADLSLCSLSHFKYASHTVHMLTQQLLLPPLTSTVRSSLFMHGHSSPLSLAARLHQCHANCSRHINNGWTFSGQTPYYSVLKKETMPLEMMWRKLKDITLNEISPMELRRIQKTRDQTYNTMTVINNTALNTRNVLRE